MQEKPKSSPTQPPDNDTPSPEELSDLQRALQEELEELENKKASPKLLPNTLPWGTNHEHTSAAFSKYKPPSDSNSW